MLVFQILLPTSLYFSAGGSIQVLEYSSSVHSFGMGHMMRICMQTHDGRLRHLVCHVAIIFSLMSLTLAQLEDMLSLMKHFV